MPFFRWELRRFFVFLYFLHSQFDYGWFFVCRAAEALVGNFLFCWLLTWSFGVCVRSLDLLLISLCCVFLVSLISLINCSFQVEMSWKFHFISFHFSKTTLKTRRNGIFFEWRWRMKFMRCSKHHFYSPLICLG